MKSVINSDEKCFEIIVSYIKRLVSNSIGEYYSKSNINNRIDSNIKGFFCETEESSLKKDGYIGLPDDFFGTVISTEADLHNIIISNPNLEGLLTLYGINSFSLSVSDSRCDTVIKSLIAAYFVSKHNESKEIIFENRKFNVHSNINSIAENIIRQLAIILGEETLATTLGNSSTYLINQINFESNSKNLGYSIVDKIVRIYYECKSIEQLQKEYSNGLMIFRQKLEPIYSIVSKYDKKYRIALLRYIETIDFELSPLKREQGFDSLRFLDEDDIKLIKKFISEFDSSNLSKSDKVKNTEYTFIDKFIYILNKHMEQYTYNNDLFESNWQSLNKDILYGLLPRYIKVNNKVIDFEQLIELSTYSINDTNYSLANKLKTKSIQRKINKQNIVKK